MSITAIVENGTIKLPVSVPDGTRVEIVLPDSDVSPQKAADPLAWMLKYAGCVDGPADFAAEHDHYIHGTPKRSEQ